jgi:hypothetical protein
MNHAVYPYIFGCLFGYTHSFSLSGHLLAGASSKFSIGSSSNTGTMSRCCKLGAAPGTELWFENDRLRLFNVMMKPGESVSWESANPLVRWVVGSAVLTEYRSDGPEPAKLVLPDKTVRFYKAISGVAWRLCNDGAGPAREIVFELLDDRCYHALKRPFSSYLILSTRQAAPHRGGGGGDATGLRSLAACWHCSPHGERAHPRLGLLLPAGWARRRRARRSSPAHARLRLLHAVRRTGDGWWQRAAAGIQPGWIPAVRLRVLRWRGLPHSRLHGTRALTGCALSKICTHPPQGYARTCPHFRAESAPASDTTARPTQPLTPTTGALDNRRRRRLPSRRRRVWAGA